MGLLKKIGKTLVGILGESDGDKWRGGGNGGYQEGIDDEYRKSERQTQEWREARRKDEEERKRKY